MKYSLALASLLFTFGCAHQPTPPPETERDPAAKLWSKDDPEMRSGDLTVWSLQKMATEKRFDELNALFNNGRSMKSLPTGYSAGAGARVLALGGPAGKALDSLTGKNWKGKYFYPKDARQSDGLNRIRRVPLIGFSDIVLMGKFTTQLLDSHPLTPDVKSNLVILNYADPVTNKYPVELILTQVQVYDVMVAVPGKYGPIYIGKTWLGKYDKKTKAFTADNKDKLTAWFFLDFSKEAVEIQRSHHWDGSKERWIDGNVR